MPLTLRTNGLVFHRNQLKNGHSETNLVNIVNAHNDQISHVQRVLKLLQVFSTSFGHWVGASFPGDLLMWIFIKISSKNQKSWTGFV